MNSIREISIAHSPDSDDAFMFYGLATSKVQSLEGGRQRRTLCPCFTHFRYGQTRRAKPSASHRRCVDAAYTLSGQWRSAKGPYHIARDDVFWSAP